MTDESAATIAASLTTGEIEALRYFKTHDAYLIADEDEPLNDFDRLFLKGLLQKKYLDMAGMLGKSRYFTTDLGRAVLAHLATAKSETITADRCRPIKCTETGRWAVGGDNWLLYEDDFDTEEEAQFVSDYENAHPDCEWERDVMPALEAFIAGKSRLPHLATAADAKPEMITAAQFVSEGYARLIDEGKCEVCTQISNYPILDVKIDYIGSRERYNVEFADNSKCTTYSEKFTVRWLPQPATPPADGSAGEISNLESTIQLGWNTAFAQSWYLNATPSDNPEGVEAVDPVIRAGEKAWHEVQKELAALRTALAAAEARAKAAEGTAVQGFIDVLNCEQNEIPAKDMSTIAHENLAHFGYEAIQVAADDCCHYDGEYVAKVLKIAKDGE